MELINTEVAIVGAGMAGLSLGLALAQNGIDCVVIDRNAATLNWPSDSFDRRTVALNPPTVDFLYQLGAWQHLPTERLGRMEKIIAWDSTEASIQFDAQEAGKPLLAFVLENREVVRALWQAASQQPHLRVLAPINLLGVDQQDTHSTLLSEDGPHIRAQCVVGADGKHSWLREQTGFTLEHHSYNQQALVTVISSETAHENTARQAFLNTGPIGLLPLAHPQQWSLIWSADMTFAEDLKTQDETEFNRTLTNALNYQLGRCRTLAPLVSIPLNMQHLTRYIDQRIAFVGDSAHSIHPLAGQGINLGLADVAALSKQLSAAKKQKKDLGAVRHLRAYERERRHQNQQMITAMRFFRECFADECLIASQLRGLGIRSLNKLPLLKKTLMRHVMY
jgi:2-octaprenylphenol hydroxylase